MTVFELLFTRIVPGAVILIGCIFVAIGAPLAGAGLIMLGLAVVMDDD